MKKSLAVALVSISLLASSDALAVSWCTTCGTVVGAAWMRLGINVTSKINSASSRIHNALMKATSQLSQELEKRMAAGVKTQDAATAWEIQRDMQYKANELNIVYTPPVSCCDGTAGNAMAKTVRRGRMAAGNMTADLAKVSGGAAATQAVLASRYAEHQAKYCSDDDVALGRCTAVAPGNMAGAEIKAATLFQPSEGQMYSPGEDEAAKQYLQMVLEPVPPQPIPASYLGTQQGRHLQSLYDARQAALSTAAWSLSRIYASRQVPPAESSAR
jgi:hypothetical protein